MSSILLLSRWILQLARKLHLDALQGGRPHRLVVGASIPDGCCDCDGCSIQCFAGWLPSVSVKGKSYGINLSAEINLDGGIVSIKSSHDRLWYGETNMRGYLFVCMAMAQVEALLDGLPVEEAVNAAGQSLAVCRDILESMAASSLSTSASPPQIASWTYGDMLAMPTVADADFDFLNTDIIFDFSDPCFLQQWTDQRWPLHFNLEEEPRQVPSHGGVNMGEQQ